MSRKDLEQCLNKALNCYYQNLDGERPSQVYKMVTELIDGIVVADAMRRSENNYSKASKLLGISRSTLKNKLNSER